MKKRVLCILACVCAVSMVFTLSGCNSTGKEGDADGWVPTSSVNMIVPYAAGGGADLLARAVADYIDLDGQNMYITNMEGAGGTIGAMEAYHSKNDGFTLCLQSIEISASSYIAGTIDVDLCSEMVWVAGLTDDSHALSVTTDSPYDTLEDVLTAAKENPESLTVAALGSASTKAAVQNFLRQTEADIIYVPYDSSAKSRSALMGGHVNLLYGPWSEVKAYVDSGDLRVLALAAEERAEIAPDVPTFKELGYDIFSGNTRSIMLPPGTDEEIARYYEAKIKEVFNNEEFQTAMRETLGFNTAFTSMDDLQDKIAKSVAWAEEYIPLAVNE